MQTSNPNPTQLLADYALIVPESDPAYPWIHGGHWTSETGKKHYDQAGGPDQYSVQAVDWINRLGEEYTLSVMVDSIDCGTAATDGYQLNFGPYWSDYIFTPGLFSWHGVQGGSPAKPTFIGPTNSTKTAKCTISLFSFVLETFENMAIYDLGLGLSNFSKYASSLQPPGSYMLQIGSRKTPSNLQIKITP